MRSTRDGTSHCRPRSRTPSRWSARSDLVAEGLGYHLVQGPVAALGERLLALARCDGRQTGFDEPVQNGLLGWQEYAALLLAQRLGRPEVDQDVPAAAGEGRSTRHSFEVGRQATLAARLLMVCQRLAEQ